MLIIGGAMANTFLLAQGKNVGKSLVEARPRRRPRADIVDKAKTAKREIVLPVDVVVAQSSRRTRPRASSTSTRSAAQDMILDIGPRSVEQVGLVLARVQDAGVERTRSAPSKWNRSTTAPSRSQKPRRN